MEYVDFANQDTELEPFHTLLGKLINNPAKDEQFIISQISETLRRNPEKEEDLKIFYREQCALTDKKYPDELLKKLEQAFPFLKE